MARLPSFENNHDNQMKIKLLSEHDKSFYQNTIKSFYQNTIKSFYQNTIKSFYQTR